MSDRNDQSQTARFLTTPEVAELCRTPAETVRYWRAAKSGPAFFKLGRRVLYAREDVEAWIDAARQQGTE